MKAWVNRLAVPLVFLGLLLASRPGAAQEAAAGAEKPAVDKPAQPAAVRKPPLAKFFTVSGTVDEVVDGRITNIALQLQNEAAQQNREAFLILEIHRGGSKFGSVRDLAKFLTSARINRVRTVAWIPESVDGNNVILALACNEIVMHPEAELGDIGLGKAVDPDERFSVLSLVENRHNKKVSPGLAAGMMDPQAQVLKVTVQQGENAEARVVTQDEYDRLQQAKVPILDVQTLKEAGQIGTFSGSKARAHDVLVVQTAESRADVAELYNLPRESLREDPTAGEAPDVRLIRIDDMIEPVLESFVERQIQRSVAGGANMIIFEIESPGGFLLSSKNLAYAIADLEEHGIRTVAYIPEHAISGAAIIALGCDEIYLHPHGKIGDAGPIEIRDGQQFERAPEKVLSLLREILRELAERKNRPSAVAMAMADKDLLVYEVTHQETGRVWYMTDDEIHKSNGEWIKGRVVPESERNFLLTLNGRRAHELKIAAAPVEDFDELKERLGIPADLRLIAVGRTWVDSLIFFLNTSWAMFLLLVIGIVCIYLELHMMTGLLGIVSAVCFSLFFWAKFLGGTSGWLEVVLFLLGIACIAIEIFLIPGFGVFGVSGGLLMLSSLVLASQTFGNLEPSADMRMMARTVGTLSAAVVAVVAVAALVSRFLPAIPFLNQMVLTPPGFEEPREAGPRLRPDLTGESEHESGPLSLLGQEGVTLTSLRPAGKAQIGDRYLDVVSDGPFIDSGTTIQVVQVSGNRVVVREA